MVWFKRILKISVIVALVVGFLLVVLSLMGGNSETLKKALEDFISQSTHTKTSVETLNYVGFYPNLAFDFEGLSGFAGEAAEIEVFSIGKVQLAMGFWDMTFNTGKIKDIHIEDIYLAPGLWGEQIVSLDRLEIVPGTLPEEAALKGTGLVGDKVFNLEAPMGETGSAPHQRYKFSDKKQVDFTLGDARARLLFSKDETALEPLQRGEDYCQLVALLLDLDIEFAHNCPVASPEEMPETTP